MSDPITSHHQQLLLAVCISLIPPLSPPDPLRWVGGRSLASPRPPGSHPLAATTAWQGCDENTRRHPHLRRLSRRRQPHLDAPPDPIAPAGPGRGCHLSDLSRFARWFAQINGQPLTPDAITPPLYGSITKCAGHYTAHRPDLEECRSPIAVLLSVATHTRSRSATLASLFLTPAIFAARRIPPH